MEVQNWFWLTLQSNGSPILIDFRVTFWAIFGQLSEWSNFQILTVFFFDPVEFLDEFLVQSPPFFFFILFLFKRFLYISDLAVNEQSGPMFNFHLLSVVSHPIWLRLHLFFCPLNWRFKLVSNDFIHFRLTSHLNWTSVVKTI